MPLAHPKTKDLRYVPASTVRLHNVRLLVAKYDGPSGFSQRYGKGRWSQAQVSQWTSDSRPKLIGERLARDIESAVGLSLGELDRPWADDGIPELPAEPPLGTIGATEVHMSVAAMRRLAETSPGLQALIWKLVQAEEDGQLSARQIGLLEGLAGEFMILGKRR